MYIYPPSGAGMGAGADGGAAGPAEVAGDGSLATRQRIEQFCSGFLKGPQGNTYLNEMHIHINI